MNTAREVQVGAWVMSEVTGKQGLVIHFNPFTGFFTIEADNGEVWTDTANFLIFVS